MILDKFLKLSKVEQYTFLKQCELSILDGFAKQQEVTTCKGLGIIVGVELYSKEKEYSHSTWIRDRYTGRILVKLSEPSWYTRNIACFYAKELKPVSL
jgi:hypothetical protein